MSLLAIYMLGAFIAGMLAFANQDVWHWNPILVGIFWPVILLWVIGWKVVDMLSQ